MKGGNMRAERLRTLREARGYTQEDLAKLIDSTEQQVYRWENGKHIPNSLMAARIAEILETSTDYLLGVSDDPTPYIMRESDLTRRERHALAAWRSGDVVGAIKVILSDQ